MPSKRWIDKKTAQHFTLVHRPQNDPLIHDDAAPSMVLNPTSAPSAKGRHLDDLASEFGGSQLRDNEGEAANHGVYYDDTEYDYMQHLRELGDGSNGGEVVFLEADTGKSSNKSKGKQKQPLEDALRQIDLESAEEKQRELLDEDILPSKNLQRLTYQSQQDIPDVLGGFQPDMDPSLREVLEALEDEAYVDENGEDDIFKELTKDGNELGGDEFEDFWEDDDDGWESDATAKPEKNDEAVPDLVPASGASDEAGEEADQVGWLEDFKNFKKDQKTSKPGAKSDLQSSMWTTTTNGGRKKKRKGALTLQSGYSMTSSSLVRTEQLGLLDARFEVLEEAYNRDDEDDIDSVAGSTISTASSVTGPMRNDFDSILDDFLDNNSMQGKRYVRKGGYQTGLEQLDEIRKDLGPARFIKVKSAAKRTTR